MQQLRLRGPVLTVTPNPAVDQTYQVECLVPGATHRVEQPLSRAGGKGLNVARVVRQAGYQALAVAPAGGGPPGAGFTEELAASGLPHVLVPVAAPTRRSMAFVDAASGETSVFNEYGHPLAPAEWDALAGAVLARLPGAGCVVGSGSLPPDAGDGFYPQLVSRCAERRVSCIIDTSGPALLAAATAGVDLLKPNREELREATGESSEAAGARRLLSAGAGAVAVSAGPEGMVLYRRDGAWRARLPEALEGNPTGAGDAAVAAFAVALAAGITDPQRLLRLATAWSAAAVLMPAAGEIHPSYAVLSARVMTGIMPPEEN
jgi:1-phosphofructokinase family hexose kinase